MGARWPRADELYVVFDFYFLLRARQKNLQQGRWPARLHMVALDDLAMIDGLLYALEAIAIAEVGTANGLGGHSGRGAGDTGRNGNQIRFGGLWICGGPTDSEERKEVEDDDRCYKVAENCFC